MSRRAATTGRDGARGPDAAEATGTEGAPHADGPYGRKEGPREERGARARAAARGPARCGGCPGNQSWTGRQTALAMRRRSTCLRRTSNGCDGDMASEWGARQAPVKASLPIR
ncbi:hypothetical protein GCM10010371_26690 [Streptomyces subrutilus]|uniref:Uncharacterized protein n=1 Tax=Streptomyces subrutilus TaxID=36818 RepID=A0A918V3W0_9ACTN|nr:hypothetical protein GCM10010371_26690 [Streptomyces subrutilus]